MTKKIFFTTLLTILAATIFSACSSKPEAPTAAQNAAQNKPGASIEAKQVAAQEESMYVAEITFKKLSSQLTPSHKNQILAAIKQASAASPIKNIQVLTWADAEYPSVHTKKLSKEDRDLVKKRNDSIENFLKENSKEADLNFYSMAERPGMLKDLINAPDSRLKKSLEVAGVPNTDTSVKTPSKASHSIIIVEIK